MLDRSLIKIVATVCSHHQLLLSKRLNTMPVSKLTNNAAVVLLLAHHLHSFTLEISTQSNSASHCSHWSAADQAGVLQVTGTIDHGSERDQVVLEAILAQELVEVLAGNQRDGMEEELEVSVPVAIEADQA